MTVSQVAIFLLLQSPEEQAVPEEGVDGWAIQSNTVLVLPDLLMNLDSPSCWGWAGRTNRSQIMGSFLIRDHRDAKNLDIDCEP